MMTRMTVLSGFTPSISSPMPSSNLDIVVIPLLTHLVLGLHTVRPEVTPAAIGAALVGILEARRKADGSGFQDVRVEIEKDVLDDVMCERIDRLREKGLRAEVNQYFVKIFVLEF
ncbi:hypothetical protein D9758_006440 [Tetrapyrgos nigripes]|uniref:Uncharacterized protein n=1 Tax=Tetrapyrgos nigripes TaxID=182062 RepID=A0A8H5LQX8_9AGAR|nr:hypothetical protein D9758_006440 [Tetrapyrgos nigripes]